MEIASERTDNILTISLEGRLDAFGASQLDEAVKKVIKDDDFFVVIDMEGVPYLSRWRYQNTPRHRENA